MFELVISLLVNYIKNWWLHDVMYPGLLTIWVKFSIESSYAHDACIILCAVYIVLSYRKLVWNKHIYDVRVIVLSVFWHKPYRNCCSCVLHILLTVLMTADCAGVCLSHSSLEELDALVCLLQRSATTVCWCHIGKRCIDKHMSTASEPVWQNIWPLSCKCSLPLNWCMLQRTDSIHSNSTEWWATLLITDMRMHVAHHGNCVRYVLVLSTAATTMTLQSVQCVSFTRLSFVALLPPHISSFLSPLLTSLSLFYFFIPPFYFCPSWPSYVHHRHH